MTNKPYNPRPIEPLENAIIALLLLLLIVGAIWGIVWIYS